MRQTSYALGKARHGAAAVEFAVVAPLLLLILLGVWELGRIIHVSQVLLNANRDGARLAAQANVVTISGAYVQIDRQQVIDSMKSSLIGNGITNLTNATFEFVFLDGSPTREPYQGKKNERFRVKIVIPYDNIRWTNLTLLNPQNLTVEANWQMLVDDPFTLNSNLPGWTYP